MTKVKVKNENEVMKQGLVWAVEKGKEKEIVYIRKHEWKKERIDPVWKSITFFTLKLQKQWEC